MLPSGNPLIRQMAGYGAVGGAQLLVDWLAFVVLSHFGCPVVVANVLGRIFGAGIGFYLNGALTFRSGDGRAVLGWRRLGRFLLSWLVMTGLSTVGVEWANTQFGLGWAWLLKPAIDLLLAAIGFLTSRYWIYR